MSDNPCKDCEFSKQGCTGQGWVAEHKVICPARDLVEAKMTVTKGKRKGKKKKDKENAANKKPKDGLKRAPEFKMQDKCGNFKKELKRCKICKGKNAPCFVDDAGKSAAKLRFEVRKKKYKKFDSRRCPYSKQKCTEVGEDAKFCKFWAQKGHPKHPEKTCLEYFEVRGGNIEPKPEA